MSKSKKTASAPAPVAKHDGPGRPKYTPVFPRSAKWTFEDFMAANGINPKTSEGGKCTPLTLRKYMNRDMWILDKNGKRLRRNPKATIILTDEKRDPNGKKGLGRKKEVFSLTAKAAGVTKAPVKRTSKVLKAAAKSSVSVPVVDVKSQTPTADKLDAIHAALAAPSPAVVIPAPEPAPAAPVAEPAPATTEPAVA